LQDLDALTAFCRDSLGHELQPQDLAIAGRNWGDVELNASSLLYKVDNKVMFELPLPEVSQAQQTKVGARALNGAAANVLSMCKLLQRLHAVDLENRPRASGSACAVGPFNIAPALFRCKQSGQFIQLLFYSKLGAAVTGQQLVKHFS
jgi:hypothetical protein